MTADSARCPSLIAPSKADLGKAIRGLRMERGMTMWDLAYVADLRPTTLFPIELEKRAPMWEALCSLAVGLEVQVSDVVRHTEHVARARRILTSLEVPRLDTVMLIGSRVAR